MLLIEGPAALSSVPPQITSTCALRVASEPYPVCSFILAEYFICNIAQRIM